jgi:hypothetical protein
MGRDGRRVEKPSIYLVMIGDVNVGDENTTEKSTTGLLAELFCITDLSKGNDSTNVTPTGLKKTMSVAAACIIPESERGAVYT